MFDDKVILITGGTGSFGQNYTKRILEDYNPKKIIILSRDELKQFEMQRLFDDGCMRYFIGDIRDSERLSDVMQDVDYVIHAASMRGLNATEYHPIECLKTNVYGAENVIRAAIKNNVKKVIALSTGKSVMPSGVNDATRLMSEKLFVAANNMVGSRQTRFSVVRNGNIVGTDASLVSFFREGKDLDSDGGDDQSDMSFYLQGLKSSVDFVLKNFGRMQGGEVFVPKTTKEKIFETNLAFEASQNSVSVGFESAITKEESVRTLEFEDHYVICPTVQFANISDFSQNKLGEVGKTISYGKQDINQEDILSVVDVLKSDFLTQGPNVPKFEETVSKYCQAQYGVATNSATSALHVACLSLGLGEGDWLWTSTNSFVASANCGVYCGAKVDFVDIDAQTYNMCVQKLEEKLIQAKEDGCLPKVVIPVHFAGQSCDMKNIHILSEEYGFKIVEDASHAIGGKYLGQPIGGCQYSDITVFSFHPVKIITTGEGGLATTNDSFLCERMQRLRSHGVTRNEELMTHEPDGDWYYQQVELGFNYRMTEMQAALGVSQMKRLDQFIQRRHEVANRYDKLLCGLPLILPYQHEEAFSSLHLYPVQLELNRIDKSHKQVFNELRENGIGANIHYIPIHTQPFYKSMGFKEGQYPSAEHYYKRAISIPMYYGLTIEDQNRVVDTLKKVLS